MDSITSKGRERVVNTIVLMIGLAAVVIALGCITTELRSIHIDLAAGNELSRRALEEGKR